VSDNTYKQERNLSLAHILCKISKANFVSDHTKKRKTSIFSYVPELEHFM